MAEHLQVVLAERQEGKTTQLVDWLLLGHLTSPWPGWSRVLIVPSVRDMKVILGLFGEADRTLRMNLGVPGGLDKLLLTGEDLFHIGRHATRNPELEIAVDNVDRLLFGHLGVRPRLISLTGEIYHPEEGS